VLALAARRVYAHRLRSILGSLDELAELVERKNFIASATIAPQSAKASENFRLFRVA
jgi:hypothetical protein